MRCPFNPGRAALAAACLATISFGFTDSNAPALRLGMAPFVGHTLTLELDGAAPDAAVDLYFSPEPDSFPTPLGILELQRSTLVHLASGTTSPTGTWSFDLPVALDASLAETGAHFQALARDPAAPLSWILSSAVHARFLGPRLYAGFRSTGTPHRIDMYIIGGATDTVVARTDFGFTSPCSRTVFADASRRTAYVLQLAGGGAPARVQVNAPPQSRSAPPARTFVPLSTRGRNARFQQQRAAAAGLTFTTPHPLGSYREGRNPTATRRK